jgi:broad-specificity NMP kinase
VRRVLITGMSGTGESSLIAELAELGYKAVDTDAGWCEPQPDSRQRWREDAIQALLATEDTDVLFVAGCEENQVKFHSQFDHIILLSARWRSSRNGWQPGRTTRSASQPRSPAGS